MLAHWLARMVANDCTHAAMEVSSHALAQFRVAGMRFDVACVTNVSRDHLDYHPSIQDYRLAKSRLLEHLAPEAFAVVNADDPAAAGYLPQLHGPALTVGIRTPAEIMATPIEQFRSEQTFLLTAGSETMPVRTQMIGLHHVYNCLVAAAVGLTYGIELKDRGARPGSGRLRARPAAADRVRAAVRRVRRLRPYPRRPGRGAESAARRDRGAADLRVRRRRRPRPPEAAADGPGGGKNGRRRGVVTNDNPRSEDPQDIAGDILQGLREARLRRA